jgi:indole-3-glycerol phosphate synthase
VNDLLDRIVHHKRAEVRAARAALPWAELRRRVAAAPPARDFEGALRQAHPMALIAEVKRASPSAGVIREDFDPVRIAGLYAANGAACLSVLTDREFFQGSLEDLIQVRRAVDAPVLRKDFIVDEFQVLEARAAGADCVLLIAECLSDAELTHLHRVAREEGLQTLIEIYEPENLDRVLALSPRPTLLGVNNRNLRTFVTNLEHCLMLRRRIPDGVLLVGESGIHSRADVERLQYGGVHAILVGESLMRSPEIGAKVRELLGR